MDAKTAPTSSMKLEPKERADLLDQTRWARDFSWDEISILAEYMYAYRARKGAVIFREGSDQCAMGILLKGCIAIYKEDQGHHQNVIAKLKKGDTFGEMSLLDGHPRSATGVAETEIQMLILTQKNFEVLSQEQPKLAVPLLMKLGRMLSQKLRQTSVKLTDFLNHE